MNGAAATKKGRRHQELDDNNHHGRVNNVNNNKSKRRRLHNLHPFYIPAGVAAGADISEDKEDGKEYLPPPTEAEWMSELEHMLQQQIRKQEIELTKNMKEAKAREEGASASHSLAGKMRKGDIAVVGR